jgi:hypothetical protein
MVLHLAHMLSWRGTRRLLWAVLLLLSITVSIRHPYLLSSFLSMLQHVRTECHPLKSHASSEALFTREDFENLIRAHDEEIKRRAAAIRAGGLAHNKPAPQELGSRHKK